ncbi:MAG TPA: FKBP-type peptidyl-prolyl cis-trans isomerase [Bacteroidales bacterium]|nr:FKBP-type peptidyl-prolyl cis-trans isomerase [Bacteroidales bacterium]
MKRINNLRFLGIFAFFAFAAISFTACKGDDDGFKTTSSGLKYKFHVRTEDSLQVKAYDLVNVYLTYRTADTILFESGRRPISFQIISKIPGDLPEGIMMMRKGDSATFAISPDKFFISMMKYRKIPEVVENVEEMYFDIKVAGIYPEPPALKAERMEANERKQNEAALIKNYVKENNITVEPSESGLYYVEIKPGKGKKAEAGKKVKVHYKGYLFDGTVFDSSYERNRPVQFTAGAGERIPAWDEGILMMSEGGKALFIVPSSLGYGDEVRNNVKPYTPLVFEIELIEVLN